MNVKVVGGGKKLCRKNVGRTWGTLLVNLRRKLISVLLFAGVKSVCDSDTKADTDAER